MESNILVPLRSSKQIRHILPCIIDIAEPGMKVVFLIRSRFEGIHELIGQLLSLYTGVNRVLLSGGNQHAIAQQRASVAKGSVFTACEPLAKQGVEIRVTAYRGSLRRVLREHVQRENVHLVVMCPASRVWALRLLPRMGPLSRVFTLRSLPPVLLVHPMP